MQTLDRRCLALALLGLAACGEAPTDPAIVEEDLGFFVASAVAERPRLRYTDGQVSMNMTCGVRIDNKLNPAIPPIYINGRPIGFC